MLKLSVLKFDKTIDYLNTELIAQKYNKQLVLLIISYLQLLLENNSNNDSTHYSSLLDLANKYLESITDKIEKIEKNISDINAINNKISELISDDTKTEKKLYIKELNKLKKSVESCFKNFKKIEKELLSIDEDFNDFVEKNDFESIKIDTPLKIKLIQNAVDDNDTLIISEKLQKIYAPYKLSDLAYYVKNNSETYNSLSDVVEKKYTLPFDYFHNHPSKSRFSESYNLLRNDGNNFVKSVAYSFKLIRKRNLNPAIIACCKTKEELDEYLNCLDTNKLENFKYFKVIYEVNPL